MVQRAPTRRHREAGSDGLCRPSGALFIFLLALSHRFPFIMFRASAVGYGLPSLWDYFSRGLKAAAEPGVKVAQVGLGARFSTPRSDLAA